MEKQMSLLFEKACSNILEKIIEKGEISETEFMFLNMYIKQVNKKNNKTDFGKFINGGKEVAKIIDKIFPNT